MIVSTISELPKIGEECLVPNSTTWEHEKLIVVALQDDPSLARVMGVDRVVHAYFASPDEEDNIHMYGNVKYYDIRTYA